MKTVLLTACLLLIAGNIVRANSDEEESESDYSTEIRELALACAKEADMSEDEINGAKSFADLNPEKVPCLWTCIFKKRGIIKDGKLQEDAVKESVEKVKALMDNEDEAEKFQAIADDCVDKYKDAEDECAMASQLIDCVYSGAQE